MPKSLSSSPSLPDPNGLLSRKIRAKAIELANVKVTEVMKVPCGLGVAISYFKDFKVLC